MQKSANHQTHSNSTLYHTRLIPIDTLNLVALPHYIKTHEIITNID